MVTQGNTLVQICIAFRGRRCYFKNWVYNIWLLLVLKFTQLRRDCGIDRTVCAQPICSLGKIPMCSRLTEASLLLWYVTHPRVLRVVVWKWQLICLSFWILVGYWSYWSLSGVKWDLASLIVWWVLCWSLKDHPFPSPVFLTLSFIFLSSDLCITFW